jgi:hypothetical protein
MKLMVYQLATGWMTDGLEFQGKATGVADP